MSKKKVHYDDFDGGTEADQDHPEGLYCGTESGDPLMSTYREDVTCKQCLKMLKFFGWEPKK